jgi:hypothetical protein
MLHLKCLEKQEQSKLKTRKRVIIEIGAKSLVSLTKMRRGKSQINKIRGKKGDITTNTNEIH